MKCPYCKVDLLKAVRKQVEIDYCPTCRGIWLDRGELDKIIARSIVELRIDKRNPFVEKEGNPDTEQDRRSRDRRVQNLEITQDRRKTSFLSEMFDI